MEETVFRNNVIRRYAIVLAVFVAAVATLFVFFGSSVSSIALVTVTAALVLVTYSYTEATNRQVSATAEQVGVQKEQVKLLEEQAELQNEQVRAQREQVEATNRQVKALTSPILDVDVELISRPIRALPEVASTPHALDVFVRNVGVGNACRIRFEVELADDFTFLVGNVVHRFKEIEEKPMRRLVPHQRKSLATILLADNTGAVAQINKLCNVKLVYQTIWGETLEEIFLLDFPYYFELIDVLDRLAKSAIGSGHIH